MFQMLPLLAADFLMRVVGFMAYTVILGNAYLNQGRALDMGLVSLATLIPSVLLVIYSGFWYNKANPIRNTQLFLFGRIFVFILPIFLPANILSLCLVSVLNSFFQQLTNTAKMNLDAQVIAAELRQQYNAKKNILANIGIIIGPALGGWLVGVQGLIAAWLSLALLLILAFLFLSRVKAHSTAIVGEAIIANDSEYKSLSGFKKNLRILIKQLDVFAPILAYCLVAIVIEIQAPLIFPLVQEKFHRGADFAGWLLGLAGLGGILGAFLVPYLKLHRLKLLPSLMLVDAFIFSLFLITNSNRLAMLLFSMLGAMGSITLIKVETMIQDEVAPERRAFVFSLMQFASGAGGATLAIGTGFLADKLGAQVVLLASAFAEFLVGLLLLGLGIYLFAPKSPKGT